MPLYSYYCPTCNEVYENLRSIKERDVKLSCPFCYYKCERIMDISSFQLKGDGWAKDGYGKKPPKKNE